MHYSTVYLAGLYARAIEISGRLRREDCTHIIEIYHHCQQPDSSTKVCPFCRNCADCPRSARCVYVELCSLVLSAKHAIK
jgi:hypothetical protein